MRSSVDQLFVPPDAEIEYRSYPNFTAERLRVKRESYALVRKHLGVAAERMKDRYDMRVRPDAFSIGQWVWYYSPRRYRGRSPKWQQCYTGPYLVIAKRDQRNYVIQLRKRSQPLTVHVDKLKTVLGDTPESWLLSGPQPAVATVDPANSQGEAELQPDSGQIPDIGPVDLDNLQVRDDGLPSLTGGPSTGGHGDASSFDSPSPEPLTRPARSRRMPSRFNDFVTS